MFYWLFMCMNMVIFLIISYEFCFLVIFIIKYLVGFGEWGMLILIVFLLKWLIIVRFE